PEDISRRPLVVDGDSVIEAITAALAGQMILEGLDQTVQPLDPGGSPAHLDTAIERIGPILREMRPSKTKWVLSAKRAGAESLRDKLTLAGKNWKVPVVVELVDDPQTSLRGVANLV